MNIERRRNPQLAVLNLDRLIPIATALFAVLLFSTPMWLPL